MSERRPAGDAILERHATLAPDLGSARHARHLLRSALGEAGREEWLDAGELALSEVITNCVLHAHTAIDVRLEVHEDRLSVEVRDRSPVLPLQRDYDDQATTGRGMGLVAAITLECGVTSLGPEGKITWFSVGEPPEIDADALLSAWDVDEAWPEDETAAAGEAVMVVLQAMPATLYLSARQHHDALLRELVLYLAEHDDVAVDMAAADEARFQLGGSLVHALDAAHAAGIARPALPTGHPSPLPWVPERLDLELAVSPDAARTFAAMQDTLDAGERLAKEGVLLVRPALPEIVAVRDWSCEQVIAQLAGNEPVPWAGTAQARFEIDVNDRDDPDDLAWDPRPVAESSRGVVAADDANRIVAVSRPLADLLGWEPAALVGRRVVTLIPPALREGHVAGFSRHLSTGEAHILGVPLELPVLHADGSEVPCRFLVEQDRTSSGRPVYLAWIEALGAEG